MATLTAHSITEAHLYCTVMVCEACQSGSLELLQEGVEEEHIDCIVLLECRCRACAADTAMRFRMDSRFARPQLPQVINVSDHPSTLIDAAQWLTLHHTLLSRAAASSSKEDALQLRQLAGLCIEEMLKFYEADNDLPPPRAFFNNQRRHNALRHPEIFARQALLARRAKLPNPIPPGRRARGNHADG